MTDIILLAVNDSPEAFHAAEVAVALARRLSARLRAVSVVAETAPAPVGGSPKPTRDEDLSAQAALQHVTALAKKAGVDVMTVMRFGSVAAEILDEAMT